MSRQRKKKQTRCALCGAAAKTVGEYQLSPEEGAHWGFAAIDCALCDSCKALPDLGSRLSARFGFAAAQGGVQ